MDLTHLFTANSDDHTGASRQQEEDSEYRNRETLFKRKGINFSTTTNEGRILRSSQVMISNLQQPIVTVFFRRKLTGENIRVIFSSGKVEKTRTLETRMAAEILLVGR